MEAKWLLGNPIVQRGTVQFVENDVSIWIIRGENEVNASNGISFRCFMFLFSPRHVSTPPSSRLFICKFKTLSDRGRTPRTEFHSVLSGKSKWGCVGTSTISAQRAGKWINIQPPPQPRKRRRRKKKVSKEKERKKVPNPISERDEPGSVDYSDKYRLANPDVIRDQIWKASVMFVQLVMWYLTPSQPRWLYEVETKCIQSQGKVTSSVHVTLIFVFEEDWEKYIMRLLETGRHWSGRKITNCI